MLLADPVSVYWNVSLCYRSCVIVMTCHCVAGPVSLCSQRHCVVGPVSGVDMSLCCSACVSVFTGLCVVGPVSGVDMSLCCRSCVSVLTCLCVVVPVSVCSHVSV